MNKNNILKKILATGMIAMTALFCTGLVAHAETSDDARIEDYEKFMQAIQEAWDEAIQEASWVPATETTATQNKSKYQSSTKTTTTAQSKSKYQTKTTTATQSKSKYQTTKTTTTTQSKSKYQTTKTTTTTQSKSNYQSFTNTTTATQDKLKYKDYNKNFNPDKTLHLSKDGKLFKSETLRTWYFYHFSDRSLNGIGKNGVTFHGLSSEKLFAAKIHDNRNLVVSFKARDGSELNDITIETNNDTDEKIVYTFSLEENKLRADLYDASFRNGLYRINITYDKTQHAYMYLYVNCASNDPEDYEFYLCYAEQHYDSENFDPMKRQKDILDLFESEGVTPENTIDN
ncbi:MAG: hypothetical protein K2O42_01270, partial [Oscillospiraceae bacterium]|nr:hypothetical protein [Oscillospiraceae bacterium]